MAVVTLEARLAAVERTLTDADSPPADLSDAAALEERLSALEGRLDAMEERLADAEGELAAVRGQVGDGSVDDEVEQVATRALATAREVRSRLDEEEPRPRERPVAVASEPDTADRSGPLAALRRLW
jgi:predicted  nucleic acid-binding Zn-ribbon protein